MALAVDLSGYRLLEILGRGTFGTVWRAVREKTGQTVAVKLIDQSEVLDWDYFQRELNFLREIEEHPHTLTVLDAQLDQEPRYIVTPLAEGGSLEERVRAERPTADETERWLLEIAEALSFIHSRAVIHCDLKPSNLLLSSAGSIRVGDLGQARRPGRGLALGTVGFMPPEQCSGETSKSPTVGWDVYGFGASAYWLLSGRMPRHGDTIEEYLAAFEEPLQPLPATVDPELAAIVESCLEPDPAQRTATMEAVLVDLERRKKGEPLFCRRPWSAAYLAKLALKKSTVRWSVLLFSVLLLLIFWGVQNHRATRYLTYRNNGIHAHESGRLEEAYLNWLEALHYRSGDLATLHRLGFMSLEQIYPEQDRVNDFRLLNGERHLVTGTASGEVSFWDTESAERSAVLRHPTHISELVVSPDEELLATASWDGRVRLFDLAERRLLQVFGEETGEYEPSIVTLRFVDGGSGVAAADLRGGIELWSSQDGTVRSLQGTVPNPEIRQLLESHPTRPLLVGLVAPNTATLWNVRTGEQSEFQFEHEKEINALAFTIDGDHLLTASDDHTVCLWSVNTGELLERFQHESRVNVLAVLDAERFASGGEDGAVVVWEMDTGAEQHRFYHRRPVHTLASGRSGRLLAVGTGEREHLWSDVEPNGTVDVWDTQDGRSIGGPWPHDGPVERVEFSRDEPIVYSASGSARHTTAVYPGSIRAWRFYEPSRIDSSSPSDAQPGHADGSVVLDSGVVLSHGKNVAINYHISHPRRHLIATASEDRTVRVWNDKTGELYRPPLPLKGPGLAVAFDPDGGLLATAVEIGTKGQSLVRVWEIDSGYPVSPSLSCPALATALELTDERLTVHTLEGVSYIWDLKALPADGGYSVRQRLRAELNNLGGIELLPELSDPVMTVDLP